MDLWWRGGYPGSLCEIKADELRVRLMAYIFLPMLNPYIFGKPADGTHLPPRSREEREQVLFGALAQALKRSGRARMDAAASDGAADDEAASGAKALQRSATRRLPNAREATRKPLRTDGSSARLDLDGGGGNGRESHRHLESVEPSDPDHRSVARVLARMRTQKGLHVRHSDRNLLALLEEEKRQMEEQRRSRCCSSIGEFYGVPLIKYLLRATWHVAFLLLYLQVQQHQQLGVSPRPVLELRSACTLGATLHPDPGRKPPP